MISPYHFIDSYSALSYVDRMPPKKTSTSETPTMTQAALRQMIADGIAAAMEAQAATIANADNHNRNTGPREPPEQIQELKEKPPY